MVETEAPVFLRSIKLFPPCNGGDWPSLGVDEFLLSQEKGPVIFRVGGWGAKLGVGLDLEDVVAQGTLGREAEKPVNREGRGEGLAGGGSVFESLSCMDGTDCAFFE
jgi:hypothetical protein